MDGHITGINREVSLRRLKSYEALRCLTYAVLVHRILDA